MTDFPESFLETIIVTGAAGGIGIETVKLLAREGRHIACIDIHDAALGKLNPVIETLPGAFSYIASTIETPDEARKLVQQVGGEIVGLIHLAGVFESDRAGLDDFGVYDRSITHNLTSAYLLAHAIAEAWHTGRPGAMVFASSLAFRRGGPDHVAYSAAKGGLIGLVRALSKKLGPHIRVNAVAPGLIDTAMPAALIAERGRDTITACIPLRRLGEAREVASVIAFLMSDAASYVTGQTINIDGGTINS